jgi:hypothetical protein
MSSPPWLRCRTLSQVLAPGESRQRRRNRAEMDAERGKLRRGRNGARGTSEGVLPLSGRPDAHQRPPLMRVRCLRPIVPRSLRVARRRSTARSFVCAHVRHLLGLHRVRAQRGGARAELRLEGARDPEGDALGRDVELALRGDGLRALDGQHALARSATRTAAVRRTKRGRAPPVGAARRAFHLAVTAGRLAARLPGLAVRVGVARRVANRRPRPRRGRAVRRGPGMNARLRACVAHIVHRAAAASAEDARARYDLGCALRVAEDRDVGSVTQVADLLDVHVTALRRSIRVCVTISPGELDWLLSLRTERGEPLSWSHLEVLSRSRRRSLRRDLALATIAESLPVRRLADRMRAVLSMRR